MDVWRLASGRYDPLSGEAARLVGGRWSSPGQPVVYTSESVALCVVEALVHVTGTFPLDYHVFRFDLPERAIERVAAGRSKADWIEDLGYTRGIGDQWLRQERSLARLVPSAAAWPGRLASASGPRASASVTCTSASRGTWPSATSSVSAVIVLMVWQQHDRNEWSVSIERALAAATDVAAAWPASADPFSRGGPASDSPGSATLTL